MQSCSRYCTVSDGVNAKLQFSMQSCSRDCTVSGGFNAKLQQILYSQLWFQCKAAVDTVQSEVALMQSYGQYCTVSDGVNAKLQ